MIPTTHHRTCIDVILVKNLSRVAVEPLRTILSIVPAPVSPEALVFAARGHRWKFLRGSVSPAFTTSKLAQAFKVFETSSQELADIIGKQSAVDKSVDAMLLLRRYALDTILKAGFGVDMGVQKAEPGGFWDKLAIESSRLLDSLGLRGITLIASNQVHNRLSRLEILFNAVVYVSAGLDSTVHAVVCALYSVATHMDIQERLRKEIHAALKEEGQLTYHAVGRMKYLDMVIKESMRLYSQNVGFVARRAVSDYTYKDLLIPKGMSIVAATSCLNVDPDIWSDPTVFDPESNFFFFFIFFCFNKRFSDENKAGINPISYLAFGSGPRNCVGRAFATLNVKTVIATLLSRYRVRMDEERHKVSGMHSDIYLRLDSVLRLRFVTANFTLGDGHFNQVRRCLPKGKASDEDG
nr:lithocholate 6-beta-hydroxylase-like [Dermacentor andersoni]